MLIDQKMNDGIAVNFFNREAMTATAIAKLAIKFKSTIIPAYCVRVNGIKFKIKYFKPIKYEKIKKLKSEKEKFFFILINILKMDKRISRTMDMDS